MKPSEVYLPEASNKIGMPKYFDPDHYLDAVEQMICADEIETALYMLDHFPGYYRDNIPQRAVEIKKAIYRQLWTVTDYVHDPDEKKERSEEYRGELAEQWKHAHFEPRGDLIMNLVKEINDDFCIADIHEFGPANFWIPAALKKLDAQFKYTGSSISEVRREENRASDFQKSKQIFCCFETIEHLWNPDDVFHYYAKSWIDADYILVGCPKYTIYGGLPNWENRDLGHLRTYTPVELFNFVKKHWPNYQWESHEAYMMVLKGKKVE